MKKIKSSMTLEQAVHIKELHEGGTWVPKRELLHAECVISDGDFGVNMNDVVSSKGDI